MNEAERTALQVAAWLVAGAWCVRVWATYRHLPEVADLCVPEWDRSTAGAPSLTVVVPARDEAANIAATIDALLVADYSNLQIVAVDDRSVDATGAILDEYAALHPECLRVLHIRELPAGWLGKTWAMESAVRSSTSEYLLFTDADVVFAPSILRRAVVYAECAGAAHLVVAPTPLVKSFGEGVLLGFFQVLGLWASRPWRVADPKAKRDVIGVGAFNLVRRDALAAIGGLEPQRMTVLEDIILGRRIKGAGLPQRVAFAPGMVRVHWAAGASGLVRVMTKNLFSGVNFRPVLLLLAMSWIAAFCLLPLLGLFWWPTLVPGLLVMGCVAAAYRFMARVTSINARYGWLYPVGALAFCWAMLRSMMAAWVQGGVVWRGTHYPLLELRRHNSPFRWRAAVKAGEDSDRVV